MFLQNINIEIYSTHNEGKSVVAERFIRAFKDKICQYMTSISKIVCFDKLEDMVNKYDNIYHITTKMKPHDVKISTLLTNRLMIKILNFKLVMLLEYKNIKNIFAKGMFQIALKKFW